MTPRGPDKQFDRERALEAALELFWRKGYEATGVSDLLEAMGIGRQSMYDTFGNKRELFLTALREYGLRRIAYVREVLRAPGSPMANLERLLHEMENDEEHCDCGCLVGNTIAELGGRDDEVAAMARAGVATIRGAVLEALQRARELGELRSDTDVEALASLVISTVQGTALLLKAERDLEFGHAAIRGLRAALAAA
ncbi:MAG: TetR family transcriptional regulator [Acidobacteria bacterium]|nr:TetR family transcriptional regulator [Acidobacteriota bacterium]